MEGTKILTCINCGGKTKVTREEMKEWGVDEKTVVYSHYKCNAEKIKKEIQQAVKDFVSAYLIQLSSIKRTIQIEKERKELLNEFTE